MDFKNLLQTIDQINESTEATPSGRVHKAGPGGYGRQIDTDDEGNIVEPATPPVKRGRGRPPKAGGVNPAEIKKQKELEKAGKRLQDIFGKLPRKPAKGTLVKGKAQSGPQKDDEIDEMAMQQPIPVVGKEGSTQQTGAGFLNIDNSPAGQAMSKALGDLAKQKKVQIVMPTQQQPSGTTSGQQPATGQQPAPAGATGQAPAGQAQVKEKWAGDAKVEPTGQYKDKTVAELKAMLAKLHKTGPHPKDSPQAKKQQQINFALRAKGGWKKGEGAASRQETSEADIPSVAGIDTHGAGLGAGRSQKVLESKRHVAARLLGRSHALAKEGYHCKYEDMEEARAYHEGFKTGLDECYGQGIYEEVPATTGGMASQAQGMVEDMGEDDDMMDIKRDLEMHGEVEGDFDTLRTFMKKVMNKGWGEFMPGSGGEATVDYEGGEYQITRDRNGVSRLVKNEDVDEGLTEGIGIDSKAIKLAIQKLDNYEPYEDILTLVQQDRELYQNLKKYLVRAEKYMQKYDLVATKSTQMSPTDQNMPKIDYLQDKAMEYEERAKEERASARILLRQHLKQGVGEGLTEGSEDYDMDSNFMVKRWAEVALEKNPNFTIKEKDKILKIAYEYAKEHAPGFVDQIWDPKAVLKAYFYMQDRNKPQGEINPDVKLKVKQQMLKVYGPGKVTFTYHHYHNYVQHEDKFGDTNSNEFDPKTGKVKFDGGGVSSTYYGEDVDEGNAFTAALAQTPKGEKFTVGGKSFTDTSDHDATFESLDKQLKALLEDKIDEGMTVSISQGQQGAPDSVTVSAQDAEADKLLNLIKHVGLGVFGNEGSDSIASDMGDEVSHQHGDIDVVDDQDGVMALIKKITDIDNSGPSSDYEQEEGTCDSCGQPMSQCDCEGHDHDHDEHEEGSEEEHEEVAEAKTCETCHESMDKCKCDEQVDEVESYDQEAEIVAEWANDAGQSLEEFKDETFKTDIDFMTKDISGGLNKQKSTGQTTIPVIATQAERMKGQEAIADWKKLAGIK